MTPTKNRARSYRLALDFRRELQRVPIRQRPSLRTWLRRYCRHRARTFHVLNPVTGEWKQA